MAKIFEEFDKLQIPDEQIGRQAVDSLRGYVYQIYQSLASWITLREGEVLLLEVAEDFAVLAKGALTATQVKDAGGSVTLRTESVVATIKALWDFQGANPDKIVYLNYLATGNIGKEKKLTFPDGHTGLTYWRVAAREGADVEPLREALLTLRLPSKITSFIKGAAPEQLRDRLLRRIKWICGTEDIEVLEKTILDQLICVGERLHLTPSDSERVRDSLVAEILRTIVKDRDRKLNRADFLRAFEKASSVSVPVSSIRRVIEAMPGVAGSFSGDISSATHLFMTVSKIPLPPRIIDRDELVRKLFTGMGQSGTLWLHGSSGVGKTVLAQCIARRSEREWLLVQLRDCSSDDLEYRLHRALEAMSSGNIGGVILDDFPTKHAHTSRLRLSMLVSEVHRMDGSVLVTGSKAPSPNLQGCLGGDCPLVEAPYLSQEEVAELVEGAGGDPKKWASVIYNFCGSGHPQLVQARITGLKQRGWPEKEILAGFGPLGGSAQEIDAERDAIRERLISELSENARELLCRLTLIMGYFDRELAVAVGEVNPPISRPGEALDILLGPWIEMYAAERFKTSPLVSDSGTKTLGKDVQSEVHKRIVDQLLTRHPFPGDFLGQLLGHAMASGHEQGLLWVAMAVMHAPAEHRKMLAQELLLLPFLGGDAGKPLFQANGYLSVLLRMTQFRIAAWGNMTNLMPGIADLLIGEARMLDGKQMGEDLLSAAIATVLCEQAVSISPKKWMPLLAEFEKVLAGEGELAKISRTLDPVESGLENWTVPQFLFGVRATSLRSVDELGELFLELDQLKADHRKKLLSSLSEIPSGNRLMIDSAWLGETNAGNVDGSAAAEKYHRLAEIAESWGEKRIAVDCECARAVMLDEYADDSKSALAAFDEAEKKYPNEVRLARGRAKVYYRRGDHPTALATIAQIAERIPKEDHVDRAFALREAGISAAKTQDFSKASHFFCEACEAASAGTDNMWAMAVGLKGDWAVAEFQLGNKSEAVNLMHQAIVDAEQIDPEVGKNEKYCRLVLGHLILWMQTQVRGHPVSGLEVPIFPGCCSNPEPSEEIVKKMASPPFVACWYQLAVLAMMLQMDSGILDDLRKRTSTQRILSCELALNFYLMAKHIISIDTDSFFSYLPEYIVKTVCMIEQGKNVQADTVFDFMTNDFPSLQPDDWRSEVHVGAGKEAILALATVAACSKISNFQESLKNHIGRVEHGSAVLGPFMECFEKQPGPNADRYEVTASHVGRLMEEEVLAPDEMFIISVRLWEWLRGSNFRITLENMVADHLIERWEKIVTDQQFHLTHPMVSVPAIETALKEPTKGIRKIAGIVLAAENAVRRRLSPDLRAIMKK